MGAVFPSGLGRTARRDARVKRIHIAQGARTLCNKPKTEGDIVITLYGFVGHRGPSNLCKLCQRAYLS